MILPQEIQDKIFMLMDYKDIKETIELQSDYVKRCTEYSSIDEAVKSGNLYCIKYLFSIGKVSNKTLKPPIISKIIKCVVNTYY